MLKKILLFLISVFVFCGCSSKETKDVVTFASWGSVTETKILNRIISDFEQENPNIKIKFIHIPQNYFQKLHLLFASNMAPDVIFINNLYLPIYSNHLEDLSDVVDKKDFYPQAIEGLSINNKLFAVPRDVSNLVLYVNVDKIVNNKKIKTLDDLLETAKNVTNKESWGIGFEEDFYWIQPYLAYFGEEINRSFNYKKSKGFDYYISLRDKHKIAPSKSQIGSSTLAQMFLDEKIAFYLSGRWMYPKIKEKAKFNWEIIAFPQGVNEQNVDSSGWAISKNCQNKELALKFVNYLSSENSAKYFTETGLIIPARINVAETLIKSEYNEGVFLEVLKTSKNTPVFKNYKKLIDELNKKAF